MTPDRRFSLYTLAIACLCAAGSPDVHAQSSSDGPTQGSLCPADQTTLFACSAGQKQIAVCGKPGNDTYDELRYRYGTERNLEADFPNEREPVPPRLFASGNQASNGAGGTLTYLRLSDGRSSFTVFSETSSPAEGAVGYESSGVLVDNHGHTETHLCDGQTPAQVGGLSDKKLIGKAVPRDNRVPEGFPTYQASAQPPEQASAQPSPQPPAQPTP